MPYYREPHAHTLFLALGFSYLRSKCCGIFFRYDKGGYLFLPSYIMRTHGSKKQQDALRDISHKTAHRVFEVHWYFHSCSLYFVVAV